MPTWWKQVLFWHGAMFATVLVALSCVFGVAHATPAPEACQDQFYNHQAPDIDQSKLVAVNSVTYIICKTQYGVLDSAITKTPLWSAEHLTADRIKSAKDIKRKNEFHPEPFIPFVDRATLADYLGSGYDRGHMSPDKDMPDSLSMHESFSLANMIPQNPCNNEIIWAAIEGIVRHYTVENGETYVVTGPIFGDINPISPNSTIGGSKVWVPTKIFKAVYDPNKNALITVSTANANVQTYETLTPDQLKEMTGITPFPTVTNPVELVLPPLHKISGSCKKGGQ